jgi:hypothetical protein
MSYQTDFVTVEYLRRRVKYYKNMQKKIAKMIDDPWYIQRRAPGEWKEMGEIRIRDIEYYITIYNDAIDVLK